MRLIDLLEGDDGQPMERAAINGTDITGLTSDSRKVRPGFLFAALPGARADGRAFIADAVGRGAAAVLAPPGTHIDPSGRPARLLTDDNPRRLYALMAARFYARQPPTVAAVTGTNGKTSVVTFARRMWTQLGRRAASLGTLGIAAPGRQTPGNLTTPDPADLHASLDGLAADGVECLAMEASSHGLAQYRLDGVEVTAAAFTNLSRDHLDYHVSMEAYLAAKLRLLGEVMRPGGVAVLNADAEHFSAFREIAQARRHRVIEFGAQGRDIRLERLDPLPEGQRLDLLVTGRALSVTLPLVGAFQAGNALCALGLLIGCGEDGERAAAALETLEGVPGRVERVAVHPDGAPVYVDYAHTPGALYTVLETLRPHVRGRLAVVFGCGGDRDSGKRPEMGRVASALADTVIVTDDNPRSEKAADIRRQILAECPRGREIAGRAEAIRAAIAELGPDDLLVVAGKGHETGQIVGDTVLPFSDAETVRAAIAELGR